MTSFDDRAYHVFKSGPERQIDEMQRRPSITIGI